MASTPQSTHTKEQAVPAPSGQSAIRFIKRQEVEGITGLSCTEIYRRISEGRFPAQVTLGPKAVVWVEAEIYCWMNDRIAESRAVV